MASIAVFLYPHRVGVADVRSAGFKPCFATPKWRNMDDIPALLEDPMAFADLVREMVGDNKHHDVYLNVWPGAYSEVMFSYDKKRSRDLNRLRQAELETVFRGEVNKLYTFDLNLDKGRATDGTKSRRIIFTVAKTRIAMLREAFSAKKLPISRIAPMDAAMAEAAQRWWAPNKKQISVCMMLDEACTGFAFFRGGNICALRTIPNGFGNVLSTYMEVTGEDIDTCLNMLRSNGVIVPCEKFDMTAIQDDVMRVLNRLNVEVVKTLHNTFGNEAVIDNVLLCGNFSRTVGLTDYMNTMLNTNCQVAGEDTLKAGAIRAIALQDADLDTLFPLATTTAKGVDLLWNLRKKRVDAVQNVAVCLGMLVLTAGVLAITPMEHKALQQQHAVASNLINQPEFASVRALLEERDQYAQKKAKLEEDIANLPHGATDVAGILTEVYDITANYGTVMSINLDYGEKSIDISFTTLSYDSFIYWQKAITESGTYSFIQPPSFAGNGLVYSSSAKIAFVEPEISEEEPAATEGTVPAETAEPTVTTEEGEG